MSATPKKAPQPRPRKFDPYRAPRSPEANALTAEVANEVQNFETYTGARKRARRPKDAEKHTRLAGALVTDLAHAHMAGRDGLAVSRRTSWTKSRYRSDLLNRDLPTLLDHMADPQLGFIEQIKGYHTQLGGMMTVIRPTERLLRRFAGLTFADLTRLSDGEEIVVLKGEKLSHSPADRVEYDDNELTHMYRAQVRAINTALRDADIDYAQDASTAEFIIDPSERHLKRRFTRGSFWSGGRLYGGWWQTISKDDRLSNTVINGERVVSLDFAAMGVTLAYAYACATSPSGDLYPTRFHRGAPGDSEPVILARQTVKKLMAACLFATKPLTQWPRGLAQGSRGVALGDAVAALQKHHPAIAPLFFTGIGHLLQFTESNILIDIMLTLIERGLIALPVHDCIVVPESSLDAAHAVMSEIFTAHTRLPARITVERED